MKKIQVQHTKDSVMRTMQKENKKKSMSTEMILSRAMCTTGPFFQSELDAGKHISKCDKIKGVLSTEDVAKSMSLHASQVARSIIWCVDSESEKSCEAKYLILVMAGDEDVESIEVDNKLISMIPGATGLRRLRRSDVEKKIVGQRYHHFFLPMVPFCRNVLGSEKDFLKSDRDLALRQYVWSREKSVGKRRRRRRKIPEYTIKQQKLIHARLENVAVFITSRVLTFEYVYFHRSNNGLVLKIDPKKIRRGTSATILKT